MLGRHAAYLHMRRIVGDFAIDLVYAMAASSGLSWMPPSPLLLKVYSWDVVKRMFWKRSLVGVRA